MRIVYNAFACPKCLRLTTKPWREAFCAHGAAFQAFDPRDEEHGGSEMDWTPMVQLRPGHLRAFVDREQGAA